MLLIVKGRYRMADEVSHGGAGSKSIQDDRAPEAQVKLSDLFGMLRDVALPLHALPEITVELDWETNGNNVIASAGEVGAVLEHKITLLLVLVHMFPMSYVMVFLLVLVKVL